MIISWANMVNMAAPSPIKKETLLIALVTSKKTPELYLRFGSPQAAEEGDSTHKASISVPEPTVSVELNN